MTNSTSTGTQQVGLMVRKARLNLANLLLPKEHKVHVGAVLAGNGTGAHGALTLEFPLRARSSSSSGSRHDGLPSQNALYDAANAIGTVHYCRFISLDDEAVYLLADFDGWTRRRPGRASPVTSVRSWIRCSGT